MFARAAESSLGKNLQRYANRQGRSLPMLNLLGVALKVLCGPMDTLAYSIGPQTTLAPLGMSLGLLFDFFTAPFVHGDAVPARNIVAAILVVAGTAVCLLNGATGEGGPGVSPSLEMLAKYAALVTAVCALPLAVILSMRKRICQVDAIAHAALGGILGSMTLVAGKVLIATLRAPNSTLSAIAGYGLVVAAVVPAHLYVLNRSFGRYSLVLLSPASGALGLLANVTTGFVLYCEVPVSAPRFLAGIALLCAGVLVLCTKQQLAKTSSKISEAVAQDIHDSYAHQLHPHHRLATE